ncbi:tRNA (adenosine(37)-N6)-threonylcarbamoyltransferase complex ATPase subunit type 1 TsaE [Roseivirga sp. E12]|uniref:tRNA (adenosine(37)-N6)-threonylcarbamoyltransferase complex ATPase subunit type 1 TsaE n=1 Tax=Roseivirga sp. E12 TaxID=2819237 RepID=UPI001ABC2336|nr:tRNA (adenosine(37)-N6)-threonylcarbamoyltransferase complex ATPase subunit type 1 TsaE [Roseivirga sp. E12]MBO3698654.1 tRNA (adenosine(37)-N6)-threonylcarbamoyltransferase complex ATPase subunit type 1 TsaE [Roseivirga sp. E12]
MLIKANSLNDLPKVASDIIAFAGEEKIWVLLGEMGAGKTTLTKALGEQLKVLDNVQSPTFSIVNEYLTASDETIYHFDFYRIEKPEEAMEIGVDEYFYSGNLCVIEWPQRIGGLMPEKFLKVEIENLEGERRNYKLTKHG